MLKNRWLWAAIIVVMGSLQAWDSGTLRAPGLIQAIVALAIAIPAVVVVDDFELSAAGAGGRCRVRAADHRADGIADPAPDAAHHRVRAGGADFLHARGARPTGAERLAVVDPFARGFEGGFGVAGLALRGVPGAIGGGGVALGRFGVFLRSCERLARFGEPLLGLGRIARSAGTFELRTARPMLSIADGAFGRFTLALGFQVRWLGPCVLGALGLQVSGFLGPRVLPAGRALLRNHAGKHLEAAGSEGAGETAWRLVSGQRAKRVEDGVPGRFGDRLPTLFEQFDGRFQRLFERELVLASGGAEVAFAPFDHRFVRLSHPLGRVDERLILAASIPVQLVDRPCRERRFDQLLDAGSFRSRFFRERISRRGELVLRKLIQPVDLLVHVLWHNVLV